MSNEVKTKEKVDMDPKYLIKLTVTLFITCVIVAGALGFVNKVTKPNIDAANARKTAEAIQKVMPEMDGDPVVLEITDEMAAAASGMGATVTEAYETQAGGTKLGYALKVDASGSQGIITMMVGVDTEGAVTGVSIVKNSETSGIGSKVMTNVNGVLDQFAGKSPADMPLTVGKNVDAIGGATVSTKGVTTGVNAALAAAGVMG